jgi:hypothetical protein
MIMHATRSSIDIANFQLSTEHVRGEVQHRHRCSFLKGELTRRFIMRGKITTASNFPTIELTKRGVFLLSTISVGEVKREKIAKSIRLRAIGEREDGVTLAQIRFRTRHGDNRLEYFPWSALLPENRTTIKVKLADRGYEWPRDAKLSSAIMGALENSLPKRKFQMVRAPGWYGSVFAIPGQVFGPADNEAEVYIDPESDAHVGAFVFGEGSLKEWKELVAKPGRKSSRLQLSIAAALAAPLLRPLGMDSFGINWFSDTSDGKTLCLIVAASVAGLVGDEGLPCWADTQSGIEALARGHRDNVMPLDETADCEHQMSLEKKSQMIAFLIARGRPRKLSPVYERNHNLTNREFRIILLSSSERALGRIARAANARRLGGEEVRFMDIPASEPGSSGIFDGNITSSHGRSLRETTKELVEALKANAIKYQGHAIRALMKRFVNDPHGFDALKKYKQQFEREAAIPDAHNAHYRVRTNFAIMYAAAALAIDYEILPWGKESTFRAIDKCMRLALSTLATGHIQPASITPAVDPHQLTKTLEGQLARAHIVRVRPRQKVTKKQARARQNADGFKINGEIYVKPDRFKQWFPAQRERNALKGQKIIVTGRKDTATVEKKIAGIKGKPRYYAIDVRNLRRFASDLSASPSSTEVAAL